MEDDVVEQIAFIIGNTYIYWNSIVIVLAAIVAVFSFLALWIPRGKQYAAAIVMVPLAAVLSVMLARLAYCYFRPEGSMQRMTVLDFLKPGEMALFGVFAGCLLAALLVRLIRLTDDLPALTDCLCLAGGAGIAVGRLASFFDVSNRGMVMSSYLGLPWACMVSNPVTGMTENRLATFFIQAIVTGLITVVLLVFYLTKKDRIRGGDAALLFLQCYGAAQVILDSTRYDSLHFRSNGFVSVVQVLGALAAALAAIVFAARMVYAGGWRKWYPVLWVPQLACFGLAGYMEYHVQRHGNEAVFAYSVMGIALMVIVVLTLISRSLAMRLEAQRKEQLFSMTDTHGTSGI